MAGLGAAAWLRTRRETPFRLGLWLGLAALIAVLLVTVGTADVEYRAARP